MSRFRRQLPLLFLLAAGGCVYFNTLYNAQQAYDQAMRERVKNPESKVAYYPLLDKVISKSSKVIREHPDSRYVDDAFLLMGKAYYHRGEFELAARALERLVADYQGSSATGEGLLWLGKSFKELGDFAQAQEVFETVLRQAKENQEKADAQFQLAEVTFAAKEYEKAIEAFGAFLARFPDSPLRGQAIFQQARAEFRLGRYDRAVEALGRLRDQTNDLEFRRRVSMEMAEALSRAGRHEEAIQTYRLILQRLVDREEEARLHMAIAREAVALARYEEALEENLEAARTYPGTPVASEALFRNGELSWRGLRDPDRAERAFEGAVVSAPASPFGERAAEALEQLSRIGHYKELISTGGGEQVATARFLLAQILLLEGKDPDEAVEVLERLIEEQPDSPWAPKTLYTLGWIFDRYLENPVRSWAYRLRLLESYEDAPYADYVRRELGREVPVRGLGFYQDEVALVQMIDRLPPPPLLALGPLIEAAQDSLNKLRAEAQERDRAATPPRVGTGGEPVGRRPGPAPRPAAPDTLEPEGPPQGERPPE